MFRHLLKPDGFTVSEVERQIRLEMYTGQNLQNRRTRRARSNREYLYWLANHNIRRLGRAKRVIDSIVERLVMQESNLTPAEIAERAREFGAEFETSWKITDRVIAILESGQ